MAIQTCFKRYEIKYMLNKEQKEKVMLAMKEHMTLDKYGRATIRNLYFDTDNYRLIRHSIEKPAYKEKLRVRCYELADENSTVFVELKKKYKKIVYKRRVTLKEKEAMDWLCNSSDCKKSTQISKEVDYFLEYYETLHPVVFLSYEREAFYSNDGSDFRVTFDENILCREDSLSLREDAYGERILEDGKCIMELKCSGGMPLWMVKVLSEEHIYKTSFSKYGTAFKTIIYPKLKEKTEHA